MSQDAYVASLIARMDELEQRANLWRKRAYDARKAREMWRERARNAERMAVSPYSRRRIRDLEAQLLRIADRRETPKRREAA